MSTDFEFSATTAATLDQYWQCLGDRAFWERRLGVVGSANDTVESFIVDVSCVEVQLRQVVPEDHIPGPAVKIVGGAMAIERWARFTRGDGEITGESRGSGVGGRLTVEGTVRAAGVHSTNELHEQAQGTASVAVPLLGKKLEKAVIDYLRRAHASEFGFVADYLAQ